ncbi:Histone transcription regulator 3 [Penicillium canariense]|uniref:Histone transcription regulator 3 homolog n=1 Tax=Penicillium canariense TaxID=189055 RepID=A0A9W9LS28_9EURO|nr:Histone transcription regulator 3 [Penicillium canariense]KAJ5174633.1 Histone transcription regulator 3 [Penicillium canariense]
MASWVALNVEPDDGIEEEVDDTKELQIEEALKLYHSALKLHSQGPEYYPQAAEAYDSLLNSEIFKYPESLSDFKRAALPDTQSAAAADDAAADPVAEFNVTDSTSSLFQTLYLSYKNHGKYLLDSLHESLRNTPQSSETAQETARKTAGVTKDAVRSFAEALERDDTDLNLWRQCARLGSALQSYRLNRFCLESVLADDDNRLEVRSAQLGLEEIFSEERLRSTLGHIFDGLSASQIPVKKPRKALEKYLKQHADLYSYLPALPTDIQSLDPAKGPLALSTLRREIRPSEGTWEAVGKALLQALDNEESASLAAVPSQSIYVTLPPKSSEALDSLENEDMDKTSEPGATAKVENEDVDMIEENQQDGEPANPEMENPDTEKPTDEVAQDPSEPAEEQASFDQSAEKQLMESLEGQSVQPPEKHAPEDDANNEEAEPKSPSDTRKRSSASAVNDDQPEGGRMKSRRTRARESNADALAEPDEVAFDQEKYYEDRLEIFVNADDWMFNTLGSLYSKVGIEALGTIETLRKQVAALNDSDEAAQEPEIRLVQDLRGIFRSWNDEKSRLMQQKDDLSSLKDIRGTSKSGLSVFLEHSRKGIRKPFLQQELSSGEELYRFSDTVNNSWLHPHETSYEWLKCLLMPEFGQQPSQWPVMKSTYLSFLWPSELKETVVKLLLREDEFIFTRMSELIANIERRILESSSEAPFEYQMNYFSEVEMIQSIYELHVDVFASVVNPSSEAIRHKRYVQTDRLARWGILARSALHFLIDYCPSEICRQNIALRHLWASTFHMILGGEAQREHILLCLQDLKHILQTIGDPCITLLNNSTLSELSVATVDQEVLKLKCMDFFAKIFNPEDEDPVSLIEAIEPILEPSSIEYPEGSPEQDGLNDLSSTSSEMASFLDRGDATLRLFLWRRLQEAYQAIDYPPKVVSCYLRSIEVIMAELEDAKNLEETSQHRQIILLGWLKSLDGILGKAIPLILQHLEKAYECVDMEHLQASISAVARLTRLVHSFVLYEDSVRVGQVSGREFRGSLAKSLENFKERMRELYVRCWILQYTLFLEAISQNKDMFDEPLEDRIRILRSVHNALGVRSMCRYSQKRFLKLMKSELLDLETKGDYEHDICQVLLDLHGIKLSPLDGTTDHGCPPEKLDRPTAIMMIDFVMRQAQNMNMKDLSKSELKTTIEKMQQTIVPAKLPPSPQMSFNRRIFHGYIKAPVNPSILLRAVQGVLELSMMTVPGENAKIAAKGWYFLLGHAALTKFRSQKRLSPGSTTELDDAINFFRQDLDHGSGRWETWYRLAQAYDTKLDEDITWTADKINNNRSDLATTQRYAIHCYAMAVSMAIRTAEPTNETRALLSDLYTDFGIRLYSSSREPLSMGAFGLSDFSRHFSSEESQQMYKGQPYKEMSLYSVWNFACNLLRRALVDKPKRWITHYFIGKCLWKMFSSDDSMRTTSRRVEMQDVLDAFHDAISSLPQRKDSRADPIFEPHFKLLSIVQKLVLRGTMTPTEASEALQATPWARKVDAPRSIEGWKPYILEVIRKFKSADKSNWHHRMSAKAAHVIYDDEKNATAAVAAKQELSQIFTKTLTIQVWRPEFERPGRHFVYTNRYVHFFVSLLDRLDDRASLDQLLRRVRKKQGDFINHTKLWEDVCLTYAKMIRRAADINEGHEEGVFRPIGWEEFSTKTARLENLTQLSPESLPLLELIRDSLELKKLNNNLMKVTMFEDLVADLYARVYELNMPLLIEQVNEENKEKMKVDHLLMAGDGNTEASNPATPLPASDTPAPRGRTKGIARRDVQKRADTIVNLKLGPRTATSKFTASAEADQSSSTAHGANAAAAPTSIPHEPGKQPSAADDGAGVQRSDANSFNDTADESELSEVEGTKLNKLSSKRKSLIPTLHKTESGDVDTETENDGADEGEGEDEGDENDDGEDDDDPATTEAEAGGEEEQGDDGEDEDIQDEDETGPTVDENKADDGEATDKEVDKDGTSDGGTAQPRENQPDNKHHSDSVKDEDSEQPDAMDVMPA